MAHLPHGVVQVLNDDFRYIPSAAHVIDKFEFGSSTARFA